MSTIRLTPVIKNVVCPDGTVRIFTIQTHHGVNKIRGFVRVNGRSVSGHVARKNDRYRWRFFPNTAGKNIELMRLDALPNDHDVKVTDPSIPDYLKRYRGRIVKTEYDGVTPVYDVRFNGPGFVRRVRHGFLQLVS